MGEGHYGEMGGVMVILVLAGGFEFCLLKGDLKSNMRDPRILLLSSLGSLVESIHH